MPRRRRVQVYTDAAVSGAPTFRPGYQKLLQDATPRALDVVAAESLDRLSRDLAVAATLYKYSTCSSGRSSFEFFRTTPWGLAQAIV